MDPLGVLLGVGIIGLLVPAGLTLACISGGRLWTTYGLQSKTFTLVYPNPTRSDLARRLLLRTLVHSLLLGLSLLLMVTGILGVYRVIWG